MARRKLVRKDSGSAHQTRNRPLDQAREKLRVLVDQANRIYRQQQESGQMSIALLEAERTRVKAHKESGEMFLADLPRSRDINREIGRVMTFLTSYNQVGGYGSTHEAGLFGAQWRADDGPGYDSSRVSEEDAKMVFDIYHRVIEAGGGWERVIGYFRLMNPGIIDYGSENLINSIYDMVQNQEFLPLAPGNDVTGEIIARSLDMIDTMRQTYESLAELQRSGNDYGSIMTAKELEYNRSYWNFLNKYRR